MRIIRINKYLSSRGVCSRREADRQIEKGNVLIDGRIASLGDEVDDDSVVLYCGNEVDCADEPVLIAFNKPKGVVCTSEKMEKNNIVDYINYPSRIYPIGRLDKDSTGLILLTNQGELVNGILKARNFHEKEYIVTVNRPYNNEFLIKMRNGVYLPELDVKTRKCEVRPIDNKTFSIVLTQGLNRQIRRMVKECGLRVCNLKRIRIMNIKLGNLKVGEYRKIEGEEYNNLLKNIKQ